MRPAVCVITSVFAVAARARLRSLGMAGHRYVEMPHPLVGRPTAEVRDMAESLLPAIVAALTEVH